MGRVGGFLEGTVEGKEVEIDDIDEYCPVGYVNRLGIRSRS